MTALRQELPENFILAIPKGAIARKIRPKYGTSPKNLPAMPTSFLPSVIRQKQGNGLKSSRLYPHTVSVLPSCYVYSRHTALSCYCPISRTSALAIARSISSSGSSERYRARARSGRPRRIGRSGLKRTQQSGKGSTEMR